MQHIVRTGDSHFQGSIVALGIVAANGHGVIGVFHNRGVVDNIAGAEGGAVVSADGAAFHRGAAGIAVIAGEDQHTGSLLYQSAVAGNIVLPVIRCVQAALSSVHVYRYIGDKSAVAVGSLKQVQPAPALCVVQNGITGGNTRGVQNIANLITAQIGISALQKNLCPLGNHHGLCGIGAVLLQVVGHPVQVGGLVLLIAFIVGLLFHRDVIPYQQSAGGKALFLSGRLVRVIQIGGGNGGGSHSAADDVQAGVHARYNSVIAQLAGPKHQFRILLRHRVGHGDGSHISGIGVAAGIAAVVAGIGIFHRQQGIQDGYLGQRGIKARPAVGAHILIKFFCRRGAGRAAAQGGHQVDNPAVHAVGVCPLCVVVDILILIGRSIFGDGIAPHVRVVAKIGFGFPLCYRSIVIGFPHHVALSIYAFDKFICILSQAGNHAVVLIPNVIVKGLHLLGFRGVVPNVGGFGDILHVHIPVQNRAVVPLGTGGKILQHLRQNPIGRVFQGILHPVNAIFFISIHIIAILRFMGSNGILLGICGELRPSSQNHGADHCRTKHFFDPTGLSFLHLHLPFLQNFVSVPSAYRFSQGALRILRNRITGICQILLRSPVKRG